MVIRLVMFLLFLIMIREGGELFFGVSVCCVGVVCKYWFRILFNVLWLIGLVIILLKFCFNSDFFNFFLLVVVIVIIGINMFVWCNVLR